MGPEGNIFLNSPISTFQQGLTHSAMYQQRLKGNCGEYVEDCTEVRNAAQNRVEYHAINSSIKAKNRSFL